MSSNSASSSSAPGIGFAGLLTVLFIALKLLHKIGWSWWWVVSPLWIGAGLAVLIVALIFGIAGIAVLLKR